MVLMTSIGEHNNISGTFSKPMCCRGRQLRQDAAGGEGMQRYAGNCVSHMLLSGRRQTDSHPHDMPQRTLSRLLKIVSSRTLCLQMYCHQVWPGTLRSLKVISRLRPPLLQGYISSHHRSEVPATSGSSLQPKTASYFLHGSKGTIAYYQVVMPTLKTQGSIS